MWQGDYHTHSTLDDGKSTLEEMAAAAHALGLPRFGFSATAGAPGGGLLHPKGPGGGVSDHRPGPPGPV